MLFCRPAIVKDSSELPPVVFNCKSRAGRIVRAAWVDAKLASDAEETELKKLEASEVVHSIEADLFSI
jgi:hypothetical protein